MVPVLISCCGAYSRNLHRTGPCLAQLFGERSPKGPFPRSLALIATFAAVSYAWIFFRADSWVGASNMSSALIWHAARGWSRPVPATPLTFFQALLLVYAALHCLLFPSTTDLFRAFLLKDRDIARPYSAWIWSPTLTWALSAGAMAGIACWLMLETRQQFIYFQFWGPLSIT